MLWFLRALLASAILFLSVDARAQECPAECQTICECPTWTPDGATATPTLTTCGAGFVCVKATPTRIFTRTRTPTWTRRPTVTATFSRTPRLTSTPTLPPATRTDTAQPTPTAVPPTRTDTAIPTDTPLPTATLSFTVPAATKTPTVAPTSTITAPPAPTRTATPLPTLTVTPKPATPTAIQPTSTPIQIITPIIFCPDGTNEYYGECRHYAVFAQQDYHQSQRGKVSGLTFYHATGTALDENRTPYRTLVCDTGNNRCKWWDGVGRCGTSGERCNADADCSAHDCAVGREPDGYLGQDSGTVSACNFDDNLGRFSASYRNGMCLMQSPDGTNRAEQWAHMAPGIGPDGHMYVGDRWNHRFIEYDENGVALVPLGQPDWASNRPNMGAPSPNNRSLKLATYPAVVYGAIVIDKQGRRYIADSGNNRIVRAPKGSQTWDIQLGQKSMFMADVGACNNPSGDRKDLLCQPFGLALNDDGTELYVLDTLSHSGVARIAVYAVDPVTGDFKAGQPIARTMRPFAPAPDYWFSAVGIQWIAGRVQSGPCKDASLMVNEFWPGRRSICLDKQGKYLGVVGSSSIGERGGANWCDQHGQCPACNYAYRIHAPGGVPAVDKAGILTLAEEEQNHVFRIDLNTYIPDEKGCIPKPVAAFGTGALPSDDRIAGEPTGAVIDKARNTLMARDGRGGILAWKDYQTTKIGSPATVYAVGARVQSRGFFAVRGNLLFSPDTEWQLSILDLPLTVDSRARRIRLVWDDTGAAIPYWTTGMDCAADPAVGCWVNGGTRMLHVKDPENAATLTLRIDKVLGQTGRDLTACNQGKPGPDRFGFCGVVQVRFFPDDSLWIVDNNYECHQNMRVVTYDKSTLLAALAEPGMFPNSRQDWIINRDFTQDFGTSSWRCGPAKDRPWSPVVIEPYSDGAIIANDGYGYTDESRVWRQWFVYDDPRHNAKPQQVVTVPTGAPGGLACVGLGCAFLDHTWQRLWWLGEPGEWFDAANP